MQRLHAFKYEPMPPVKYQHEMSHFAGSCTFVINKMLTLRRDRHEKNEKSSATLSMAINFDPPLANKIDPPF